MKTKVAIIGAGPSGLLLATMLKNRGIECIILENRNKSYLSSRIRAGVLDYDAVQILKVEGVGEVIKNKGFSNSFLRILLNGKPTLLDVENLTNGKFRSICSQTDLVKELLSITKDQHIIWEAKGQRMEGLTDKETTIHYTLHGKLYSMTCDYVVGCDSWRGICGPTTKLFGNKVSSKVFPFSWYGLLVEDKNTDKSEVVYAYHNNGLAIKMPNTKTTSRLYIQCENGTDPDSWNDDQIWDELDIRMGIENKRERVLNKEVHSLSSYKWDTMQYGNLFLAGDAAHLLPIMGGKGLNMAISDVKILADAFAAFYTTNTIEKLNNYSENCTVKNNITIDFVKDLTTMLHFDKTLSSEQNMCRVESFLTHLSDKVYQKEFANTYVNTFI